MSQIHYDKINSLTITRVRAQFKLTSAPKGYSNTSAKKCPQKIYLMKGKVKVPIRKRLEERVDYFTTLMKQAHTEKEDNPNMTISHNLTNNIVSQR